MMRLPSTVHLASYTSLHLYDRRTTEVKVVYICIGNIIQNYSMQCKAKTMVRLPNDFTVECRLSYCFALHDSEYMPELLN